jgi:hypothetical protein
LKKVQTKEYLAGREVVLAADVAAAVFTVPAGISAHEPVDEVCHLI